MTLSDFVAIFSAGCFDGNLLAMFSNLGMRARELTTLRTENGALVLPEGSARARIIAELFVMQDALSRVSNHCMKIVESVSLRLQLLGRMPSNQAVPTLDVLLESLSSTFRQMIAEAAKRARIGEFTRISRELRNAIRQYATTQAEIKQFSSQLRGLEDISGDAVSSDVQLQKLQLNLVIATLENSLKDLSEEERRLDIDKNICRGRVGIYLDMWFLGQIQKVEAGDRGALRNETVAMWHKSICAEIEKGELDSLRLDDEMVRGWEMVNAIMKREGIEDPSKVPSLMLSVADATVIAKAADELGGIRFVMPAFYELRRKFREKKAEEEEKRRRQEAIQQQEAEDEEENRDVLANRTIELRQSAMARGQLAPHLAARLYSIPLAIGEDSVEILGCSGTTSDELDELRYILNSPVNVRYALTDAEFYAFFKECYGLSYVEAVTGQTGEETPQKDGADSEEGESESAETDGAKPEVEKPENDGAKPKTRKKSKAKKKTSPKKAPMARKKASR